MALVRRYTTAIIWSTLVAAFCAQLALAFVLFGYGIAPLGIIFLFVAVFTVLAVVIIRSWIPFATLLITTSCEVAALFPGTVKIANIAVLAQGVWLAIWTLAAAGSIGNSDHFATFGCVVALFWTTQVRA